MNLRPKDLINNENNRPTMMMRTCGDLPHARFVRVSIQRQHSVGSQEQPFVRLEPRECECVIARKTVRRVCTFIIVPCVDKPSFVASNHKEKVATDIHIVHCKHWIAIPLIICPRRFPRIPDGTTMHGGDWPAHPM